MGQPTHFEPGRHYGVFGIPAPKHLAHRKLTWTLVVNDQTVAVQLWLTGCRTSRPRTTLKLASRQRGRVRRVVAARGSNPPPNFDVSSAAPNGPRARGDLIGPRPDITLAWKEHRGPAPINVNDPTVSVTVK